MTLLTVESRKNSDGFEWFGQFKVLDDAKEYNHNAEELK